MDLTFLNEYLVLVVFGICLCVGYVIKHTFTGVDNKFIPLIMAVLGVVLNIWFSGFTFSPEILLGGLFSGLSSTGSHQMLKQLMKVE